LFFEEVVVGRVRLSERKSVRKCVDARRSELKKKKIKERSRYLSYLFDAECGVLDVLLAACGNGRGADRRAARSSDGRRAPGVFVLFG